MSGGSAPAGNTTTVQTNSPWAGQLPYLQGSLGGYPNTTGGLKTIPGTNVPTSTNPGVVPGVLPMASSLYESYVPQYYPGTTYSPETAAQSSAISQEEALGLNPNSLLSSSQNAANNILSPGFLNSNPGNAAYSDILNGGENVKSAISQALPGLLDTFTQGNRLDSPGAAYGVGQGIGSAVGNLELQAGQGLSQNYGQAAGQQNTANITAPGVQQMPYTALENAYGAGATQQQLGQNVITDALNRWNYNQTLPYNLLDQYAGLVNGNSLGSTSSLTSPYFSQQSGGWQGALGGAASGAALGTTISPGYGTAAGAIIGGLIGGFG